MFKYSIKCTLLYLTPMSHYKNIHFVKLYDFSDDAVLMVLASELYNEEDYIRDYDVFLEMVRRDEADKS